MHSNIEMDGRCPGLRVDWISPAASSRSSAALAAPRLTLRYLSDFCVSLSDLPFAIPCSHQMAIATLSALPGNIAALLSHSRGTGPLRKGADLGVSTNWPSAEQCRNRRTAMSESSTLSICMNRYLKRMYGCLNEAQVGVCDLSRSVHYGAVD